MKKKLVVGLIVALLIILTVGVTLYRNSRPAFSTVTGTKVEKGLISEELYASGRLELSDAQEVYAPFAAKIKKVAVKLGDRVQAGQILFELDSDQLTEQIEAAKLNLSTAKANLSQARKARADALADAKHAMDQAAATLEQVKSGQSVMGLQGKMSLPDAQAAYDNAKTAYDRLRNNPDSAGQGSLTTLQNMVKQAELSLDQLQKQLQQSVVKAPCAGTVVALNAVAGTSGAAGMSAGDTMGLAQTGGSLVTLGSLDKLRARLEVNEVDSNKVKAQQKVKITGDAFDKEYSGTVTSVAPTATTSAGAKGEETTVEVLVALDNSTGLKPGYNVNATLTVAEKTALLLPLEAIVERQGKQVVFVESQGVAQIREVTVGISNDENSEITSGVKEGDNVILNPEASLKQGDQVKIQ